MNVAVKLAQRIIKSVPSLYVRVKAAQLARWTADDQRRFQFYAQFVEPGSLCFDIGANFGNRVKVFLRIGAKVVAVEPLDECIKTLRSVYGSRPDLVLVEAAAGAQEGDSEIRIPDVTVIASMSLDWMQAVKNSGRFADFSWNETRKVKVTTLERLIETYGEPDFIKVDVEGFEFEVVRTLQRRVRMLSLEYTAEYIEPIIACIDHIALLGDYEFNHYAGENMAFASERWIDSNEMKIVMRARSELDWGDVYARLRGTAQ
jgi:FkbM family methyltransferase